MVLVTQALLIVLQSKALPLVPVVNTIYISVQSFL